ncbi:signal peptidase I [Klenkia marina]|uniref:Signal peptidase I n=1 Tax=Klenkia marina TaxID=1960309 RepID=A0A1G4X9N8_9ACTN|nr:signal peptidase I [Klenkia marina]SCX37418.1 signal peptidase I [Klenkia marina]
MTTSEPSSRFGRAALFVGRAVGLAAPSDEDFVERVIATGGQTVQCCDDQGRVLVDGQPLDEPYLFEDDARPFGPVTLADGQLWVMGDHRSNSADSRDHGPISVDDVIGKASLIVWPPGRLGWIDSPDPRPTAAADPGPVALDAGPAGLSGPRVRRRRRRCRPVGRTPAAGGPRTRDGGR